MKKGISFLIALILCVSIFIYPVKLNVSADTVVTISDSVLRDHIIAQLKLSSASQLTKANMSKLIELDISNKNVRSLSGIENAVNLKSLKAENCGITGLTYLSKLTKLQILDVSDNPVSSASSLSACTALTDLDISYTGISSTTFLKKLTDLRVLNIAGTPFSNPSASNIPKNLLVLDISNTKISTLNVISQLTYITKLNAANTAITDINSIEFPQSLKSLDLSDNALITPDYNNLKNIQMLYLSGIGISSVSAMSQLSELSVLDISDNSITSLKALTNLEKLTALDISGNIGISLTELPNIKNLKSLWANNIALISTANISKLTELKLLDISNNKLNTLSYAGKLTKLVTLAADNTGITDISSATKLKNINELSLNNNDISDITSLVNLSKLNYLDISGNAIDFANKANQLKTLKEISSNGTQVITVKQKEIKALIKDISNLPPVDNITTANFDKCVELFCRYNALSAYEQKQIENADKLIDCYNKAASLMPTTAQDNMVLTLQADKSAFDSTNDEINLTLSFSGKSAYPNVAASLYISSGVEIVSLSSDMAVVKQQANDHIQFLYKDETGKGIKEGILGTATIKPASDIELDNAYVFTFMGESATAESKIETTDVGVLTIKGKSSEAIKSEPISVVTTQSPNKLHTDEPAQQRADDTDTANNTYDMTQIEDYSDVQGDSDSLQEEIKAEQIATEQSNEAGMSLNTVAKIIVIACVLILLALLGVRIYFAIHSRNKKEKD